MPQITQLQSNRDRISPGFLRGPKAQSPCSVLLPPPSEEKGCPGHTERRSMWLCVCSSLLLECCSHCLLSLNLSHPSEHSLTVTSTEKASRTSCPSILTLFLNLLCVCFQRRGGWKRAAHSLPLLLIKSESRASLVAQWLRICLLMQETRVRALVWEDPTCHGAAGPVSHSC